MAAVRYAVETFRTDYLCDQCQTPVRYTGISKLAYLLALPGKGTLHQHRCPSCEAVVWLEREYPMTEYVPFSDMDFERAAERISQAISGI